MLKRTIIKKIAKDVLYDVVSDMSLSDRIRLCDFILKRNSQETHAPRNAATSCTECGIWFTDIEYGYEFCVVQQCRSCLQRVCVGCTPNGIHYKNITCEICDRDIPMLCDYCEQRDSNTNLCFNCQAQCAICEKMIYCYDDANIKYKTVGYSYDEYVHRDCC